MSYFGNGEHGERDKENESQPRYDKGRRARLGAIFGQLGYW